MKSTVSYAVLALALGVPGTAINAQTAGGAPASPGWEIPKAGDIGAVLPVREQARVYNEILERRLDSILPAIMREEGRHVDGHQLRVR